MQNIHHVLKNDLKLHKNNISENLKQANINKFASIISRKEAVPLSKPCYHTKKQREVVGLEENKQAKLSKENEMKKKEGKKCQEKQHSPNWVNPRLNLDAPQTPEKNKQHHHMWMVPHID